MTQEYVTCITCTVSVHFGCRVSEDGNTNCDAHDTGTCVTNVCEGEACDFRNPLCACGCSYLQCGDNSTEILSCGGGLCDGRQLLNMTDVQDINVASEDTVLSFDLTSFVQGSLDNEDAYLSLRLSLAGEDGEFLFGSSRAIESYRPSLKIMYSPASAVLDIDTEAVCAYTGRCDDEISMEPQSVTFTGSNWFVPQTISVFPVDDQIDEEPFHPASILHEIFSADEGYVSLGAAPTVQFHPVKEINVTVEDNDEAFVLLSRSNLTLPEDEVAEYSLHLSTEPIANVSILISTGSQLSLRTPPILLFTALKWDVPQIVQFEAEDDVSDNIFGGWHTNDVVHVSRSLDARYNSALGCELCSGWSTALLSTRDSLCVSGEVVTIIGYDSGREFGRCKCFRYFDSSDGFGVIGPWGDCAIKTKMKFT